MLMAQDVVPGCSRCCSEPSSPRGGRDLGGLAFRRFRAGVVSSTLPLGVDQSPQRRRLRLLDWGHAWNNCLPEIDHSTARAPPQAWPRPAGGRHPGRRTCSSRDVGLDPPGPGRRRPSPTQPGGHLVSGPPGGRPARTPSAARRPTTGPLPGDRGRRRHRLRPGQPQLPPRPRHRHGLPHGRHRQAPAQARPTSGADPGRQPVRERHPGQVPPLL